MKTTTQETTDIKTYSVRRTSGRLIITGKGNDPAWVNAPHLTNFLYPWEEKLPHHTSFRALHDDEWLYCLFEVTDPAVHITVKTNKKQEVVDSSRTEIFFKADDAMNPYYCLEIDAAARVLDYQGFYHRKFDFEWSWPTGHLQIRSHRWTDGYSVEIGISKESLRQLGLLNDNSLQAGLYRADCTPQSGGKPDFKWISWIKPDSATPDFHIPSSFGRLELEP